MGRKSRKRPRPRPRHDPKSWLVILLFPLIFIVPATIGLVAGGKRAMDGFASAGWPTVEGAIVYAGAKPGSSVEVQIAYDYLVDGTHYRSFDQSFSASHARDSHGYRVGQKVPVHYKPTAPGTAVLEPGVGSSFLLPLFSALFLAVGVIIGVAMYRSGP